jgi:RNA polymerase sigma-B factor
VARDISPKSPPKGDSTAEHERDERDSATGRLLLAYRKEGDTRARDRLVALYLPLVETLARRFRGSQAEHDDLVQAGSIGLLNAIERYDPARGDEFAAYAVPTVSGEMKRYIRDRGATVRLPRGLQEAGQRLPSAREGLTRRLGRDPSDDELATELEITSVELASLEAALRKGSAGEDVATAAALHEPDSADERLVLADAFETLDEQEREIVHLRFVEDLDRKEVARRLGISQSQLGRRTRAALSKLRSELEDDGLRKAAAASVQPAPTPQPPAGAPAPSKKAGGHSGRLLLRMPRPLHDDLAEAAEREGVSLNRFITDTLTAAIDRRETGGPGTAERSGDRTFEAREVPRWLPAAIVANIVVVVIAALVGLVLLVLALQNGW